MDIIVFDRDEKRIADLNPESVNKPLVIEDKDGVMTFSFEYANSEEDVSALKGGNYVAFLDEDENIWKEYEIVSTSENITTLIVSGEHRYQELATEELVTWNTNADNASIAMGYTLAKTRWQVGIVENTRALQRSVFDKNPLEALRFIEREWGGVLRFRIVITGSGNHVFYVDLLERRGAFTGLRFEFGHNLKDFEHNVEFGLIKTAMYGRGKGEAIENSEDTATLTFADVVWSVANGDPIDKPLGQDWVGFEDKRLIYGKPDGQGGRKHAFGTWNSQAETPEGLLWETYFKLQEACEPVVNVRASVLDLEKYSTDFSHESIRLGDENYLIAEYENRRIDLLAEVIRTERNPDNKAETVVELGNYLPTSSKRLHEIEKNVSLQQARAGIYERAGALNPDGTVPTSILSGVIDAVQNEFHSSVGFVYNVAEGILVLNDNRDTGNPTEAMLISGGKFFLANSKNPDGSWKWRTFGGGGGFVADELISGKIKTDLVEIFGSANFHWNGDNIYITNPADATQQIRIGKYDGINYGIAFTTNGGETWQNSLDFNGLHISYSQVTGLSTQLSTIDTKATNAETTAAQARNVAENVVIKPAFAIDFMNGNIEGVSVSGGAFELTTDSNLKVTTTAANSYVLFTPPSALDGGTNEKVAFRIRYIGNQSTTDPVTWDGQIYYSTADETEPAYTGHGASDLFKKTGLSQPTKDGAWNYYIVDMHTLSVGGTDWKDHNINYVRIDLWDYAIFELQFFTIGTVSPNLATPEDIEIVTSRVNAVELDISSDRITQKVTSNASFAQMMDKKANSEDLGNYTSQEEFTTFKNDIPNQINAAIEGQDFSDFVTSSELTTEVNSINAKFEAGGGVNVVKNSTGLSNFDFWTTSYATRMRIVTNSDLEKMGFTTAFQFPALTAGSNRYIVQTVSVKIGKPYTLSGMVNKTNVSSAANSDGALNIQIINPDGTGLALKQYKSEVKTNGYESFSLTFTPLTDTVQVRVFGYGLLEAIVAGIMLNLGTAAFQWTMANGELYNTNVGFDLNGIRVSQMSGGKETNRTIMTPVKFGGYFDVNGDGIIDIGNGSPDEVFRMDKDEFIMKNAVVREVLTLGKAKIIMVDGGGNTGLAFVPNT